MIAKSFKNLDRLTRDVVLVFFGTSVVNLLNLFYQLFIVRRLTAIDFACFNTLISIIMLLTTPASTFTQTINKFTAGLNAHNQKDKIILLLAKFSRLVFISGFILFALFCFFVPYLGDILKIADRKAIFISAVIVLISWIAPVYSGALQGLERFSWWTYTSILTTILKLFLVVIFILWGWGISGALGAFAISLFVCTAIFIFPLKDYLFTKLRGELSEFKDALRYLLPVALTSFCFIALVSMDMVLVKFYFEPQAAGYYSVAQMVGKIFLFLPGPISIVMFPKTAGLNAKKQSTSHLLRKSIIYAGILGGTAAIAYNLAPSSILRLLTGKDFVESILLARLFSVSMGIYALVFILLSYHLSIGDLRFIKTLVMFTLLELLAIIFFHASLLQIQIILCVNAMILFLINLNLGVKEAISNP